MNTVIFGGSFNPVHTGHAELAAAAARLPWVDRLLIVPDHIPPHKAVGSDFASDGDRLAMCRLLADLVPKAEVSTLELDRGGTSYMFDTVTALKKQYPTDAFFLLLGGDMALTVDGWYRGDELIRLCGVVTTDRSGFDMTDFAASIDRLRRKGCDVRLLDGHPSDISSTEVRNALEQGEDTSLVPSAVLAYIRKHHLYRKKSCHVDQ